MSRWQLWRSGRVRRSGAMTDAITSLLTRAHAALRNSPFAGTLNTVPRNTAGYWLREVERDLEQVLSLRTTSSLAASVARSLGDDPDSAAALAALRTDQNGNEALRRLERVARRGLSLAPESVPLWLVVAAVCVGKRNGDELTAALDSAVAIAPTDADLLRDAVRLRIEFSDTAGALRDARALVALAPGDAEASALLARALLANGRVDEATVEATAAVRLAPTDPEGHLALGLTLMEAPPSGDLVPARESLRRALQLSPNHHGALVALNDLRRTVRQQEEQARALQRTNLPPAAGCDHADLACLNPHEFIRKYECAGCAGVMMCACDRAFGEQFLAHQLRGGTRLDTQERVAVALGFVEAACASCRGLPEIAAPSRDGSPIARYYWREIYMETTRRAAAEPGAGRDRRDALKREVEREFEALHARAPKYVIVVPSKDEVFLREVGVVPRAVAVGDATSAEDVVAAVHAALRASPAEVVSAGNSVQTLYAVLMGELVRDAADPEVQLGFFGRRPIPRGGTPPPTEGERPRDHGSIGYYRRRTAAIEQHLASLDVEWPQLLDRFEASIAFARPFTAYLWAEGWYDEARAVIPLLPRGEVPRLLRWMVQHYWDRREGWPDLLVRDERGTRWVGVLAPNGQLTEANRRWITERTAVTSLSYELIEAVAGGP